MITIPPEYQMDANTAAEILRDLEVALAEGVAVTVDENSHQGIPAQVG